MVCTVHRPTELRYAI